MTSLPTHSSLAAEMIRVFNQIPFNKMLGLQLDKIENDHIITTFTMKKELVGNFMYGILHGGVISSVLDVAGGAVAMIAAAKKYSSQTLDELATILSKTSTINLHIDFLRPGKGEHFSAKAWIQHQGSKITFTRMELHNEDALIASGMATYRVG